FATERHADDRPCRIRAVLDAAWPESVFKTPAAVGSRRMDRDDGLSAIELFSGDAARFPEIRFVWSHAGGSLPFLASRIDGGSNGAKEALPNGFMAEARKFYYDLAGAANKGAVASLLQLVKPSQILFGTDFPPGGSAASAAAA